MRLGAMVLLALAAAACGGSSVADSGSGTPTGTTGTTTTPPPPPEDICDDGIDNDEDGLFDCEDADCDDFAPCTWPTVLQHDAIIGYAASSLAKLAGIDDCTTVYTSSLVADDAGAPTPCADCDRHFAGDFTYQPDDCASEIVEARPVSGWFGFRFTSDAAWEVHVYLTGDKPGWDLFGTASNDGLGTFSVVRVDALEYNGTDLGELTSNFAFTR